MAWTERGPTFFSIWKPAGEFKSQCERYIRILNNTIKQSWLKGCEDPYIFPIFRWARDNFTKTKMYVGVLGIFPITFLKRKMQASNEQTANAWEISFFKPRT